MSEEDGARKTENERSEGRRESGMSTLSARLRETDGRVKGGGAVEGTGQVGEVREV